MVSLLERGLGADTFIGSIALDVTLGVIYVDP